MAANPSEAHLYQRTAELLGDHESLLGDRLRNQAFHRALKQYVTPDTCVLDIGSGTGLWAIVAARLGAKKVVAIEQEPCFRGDCTPGAGEYRHRCVRAFPADRTDFFQAGPDNNLDKSRKKNGKR
jgi:hypothetical protein